MSSTQTPVGEHHLRRSGSVGLPAQRPEQRVLAEGVAHCPRVGVEVQQRSAALHRGGQVAHVVQRETGVHVAGLGGGQADAAVPAGKTQAARIDAVAASSTPGTARRVR